MFINCYGVRNGTVTQPKQFKKIAKYLKINYGEKQYFAAEFPPLSAANQKTL